MAALRNLPPQARPTYQRVPNFIERWSRERFWLYGGLSLPVILVLTWLWWPAGVLLPLWGAYLMRGIVDMRQEHHAVLRNFPVLGHLRYVLESLRPEIRQYFVESDHEQLPFSREFRSVAYQRAKQDMDTMPFGTRHDLYENGVEWLNHSLLPVHVDPADARVTIGGPDCTQPYSAAIFNISAMSFGSLSKNAILALNQGARQGNFYHNTGEGGLSPYHLEGGGDLVWQIGTGYFGCRTPEGNFNPEMFAERAAHPSVKMIEIKLSQGAKPAHGGILPAAKVTEEISRIRAVPMGRDVLSPPYHTAFDGFLGLMEFISRLRKLSGGKPVGFKLCVGNPVDLLALVRAMLETEITPDFITVDGAEGGTGAAPIEFSNSVGMPLTEALVMVDDALRGAGLRDRVKLISSGRIITGFHVVRQLALGADLCNSARGMMFALGCIQALKCNTNKCPVGVATQRPELVEGLVVPSKASRVYHFQKETVEAACELVGAAGISAPHYLRRYHLMRRISPTEVRDLSQIFPIAPESCLIEGKVDMRFAHLWGQAWDRMHRKRVDRDPTAKPPPERDRSGHSGTNEEGAGPSE